MSGDYEGPYGSDPGAEYARIYGHADVYGNAQVYGRADIGDDADVYGRARVYDNAQVFGERVKIEGHSEVYGEAEVSDYNDALRSREDVSISGYAQVSGKAVIVGGMSLACSPTDNMVDKSEDSWSLKDKNYGPCVWNNKEEYKRAANELYENTLSDLTALMEPCWRSEAGIQAKVLLNPDSTPEDLNLALTNLNGCEHIKAELDIGRTFAPSPFETALGLALVFAGAGRWGLYMKS